MEEISETGLLDKMVMLIALHGQTWTLISVVPRQVTVLQLPVK
jgi:hypothetical protein